MICYRRKNLIMIATGTNTWTFNIKKMDRTNAISTSSTAASHHCYGAVARTAGLGAFTQSPTQQGTGSVEWERYQISRTLKSSARDKPLSKIPRATAGTCLVVK